MKRAIVLVFIIFGALQLRAGGRAEILSPSNNASVPWRACVVGHLAVSDRPAWLIIRPLETSDFFVQPVISVRGEDERPAFRVMGYFGESTSLHNHKRFEMGIVQGTRVPLREGFVLPAFPEAAYSSPIVEVVRDDRAPARCGEQSIQDSTAARAAVATAPSQPLVATVSVAPKVGSGPQQSHSANREVAGGGRWPFLIAAVFAATIYLALIFLPKRTTEAADWLRKRIRQAWTVVDVSTRHLASRVGEILTWAWHRATLAVVAVWRIKGVSLTIRDAVAHVLSGVILVPAVYLMIILDARMIMAGLGLVLHIDVQSTVIDDIIGLAGTVTATPQAALGPALFQPIVSLYKEPLGAPALGLAVAHGAFAAALYSGWHRQKALGTWLWMLLKERPLPLLGFALLNVALAALAGYRAFEQSPSDVSGAAAAAFAAAVGLAIPWMMAFCVHVIIEAASDLGGVQVSMVSIVAIVAATSLGTIALTAGALIAIIAIGTGFTVVVAVAGICLALLWCAVLIGELFALIGRTIRNAAATGVAPPTWLIPAQARLLSILVIVVLASLALVAAATAAEPELRHDASRPHNALVIVIDASKSVDWQQFEKSKLGLIGFCERNVHGNDLVWLVVVNDRPAVAELFKMPFVSNLRSRRDDETSALDREKAKLIKVITDLRQTASTSNLTTAVDVSLSVLITAKRATMRTLLVSSDFVEDTEDRPKTATPRAKSALSAARMRVVLLLTRPDARYLRGLGLSQTQLLMRVRDDWTRFFIDAGATTATATPIDAVAQG